MLYTKPDNDATKHANTNQPDSKEPNVETSTSKDQNNTPVVTSIRDDKSMAGGSKESAKKNLKNLTARSEGKDAMPTHGSGKRDDVNTSCENRNIISINNYVIKDSISNTDVGGNGPKSVIEQLLTRPTLPHLEMLGQLHRRKLESEHCLLESQDKVTSDNRLGVPSSSANAPIHGENTESKSNNLETIDESSILSTSSVCEKNESTQPLTFEAGSVKSDDDNESEKADDNASMTSSMVKSEGKKKGRRRGSAWSDEETDFLMEIWARQVDLLEHKEQKAKDESATCAATYRLIAKEMATKDCDKSWEQCKTRIHTLKRAYKITKDEIDSGMQTITYCRHFDKLEIIHGDNPTITPGALAASLGEKRMANEAADKPRKRTPVKRKLIVGEPPAHCKRSSGTISAPPPAQGNTLPPISTFNKPIYDHGSSNGPESQCGVSASHALELQNSQPSNVQQGFGVSESLSRKHQAPPPYGLNNQIFTNGTPIKTEVNNNLVSLKSEYNNQSGNETGFAQSWNYMSPASLAQNNVNQSNPGQTQHTGIERMIINLEMKKLEVEQTKIEMEERQRREERNHQYRMMQLLLVGLGQQNIPQILNGQGSDVANAQCPDFARFLESGLVPGGQQTANEKGLSFSEL